MKNPRTFPLTCALLTTVLLALSGCKLEIRVPDGGRVVSTDGAYICEAGQSCVIDVVDIFFDETFVAEPAPGYSFSGWRDKDRHLCGGETTPCRVATTDSEGNSVPESVLESDETAFLQPRFSVILGYCPESKLVVSPAPPPSH